MIPVLISAVGSELAFAVIKAARLASLPAPIRLIGCDMYAEVVGKYWCDEFAQVPPARDEAAHVAALESLMRIHQPKVFIPTSDAETSLWARRKADTLARVGCRVLVNEPDELERFSDKWAAHQWFVEHAIPSPRTWSGDSMASLRREIGDADVPLVVKPRIGGGSRFVYYPGSCVDLERFLAVVPEPVVQERVGTANEEYTAGTYRDVTGHVRVIVLRRTLKFGMTNTAETVSDPALEQFCRDTIARTQLTGSNNIQFRLGPAGPMVLEINPRFSGTAGIRAHFGFNDVEMAIREALGLPIDEPRITPGRVMRYMHELYVTNG